MSARGSRAGRWARRAGLTLGVVVLLALVAAGAGVLWFRGRLKASLPAVDGTIAIAGLSAPVEIARDARGAVTVTAGTREDLARATGFVHAQDRFFQMDLLRRRAAGELAALFGKAAVPLDRSVRVHGFRQVARRVVEAARPRERAILDAYTDGVNHGLRGLRSKPFEYILLRAEPEPWKAEDSALVILAMFLDLQNGDGASESALGLVRDLFPPPLAAFLAPQGTEWDAPLEGPAFDVPPIPGPEVFDLRRAGGSVTRGSARGDGASSREGVRLPEPTIPASRGVGSAPPGHEGREAAATWVSELFGRADGEAVGSNSFAVAASRTADGRAIVASDMHLGLNVPNIWYRMSFVWRESGMHRVVGVTLPGTPAMVAGSNTRIAWAFTNSYTDTSDLVLLEPGSSTPGSKVPETYLTPDGPKPYERRTETIAVKGAPSVSLEVLSTIWGPVLDKDHLGRPRVLRWVAHDPATVNVHLLDMEEAGSVDDALKIAHTCGVPAQNIVIADAGGRIGWSICGMVPSRRSDGGVPASWAHGALAWDGWLLPPLPGDRCSMGGPLSPRALFTYPEIVDPPAGCLWTANARVVGGAQLARVGDGGYVLGARAKQIRDDLLARPRAAEPDLLAIQLDDRALFLERWRTLLLEVLDERALAGDPKRKEMKDAVTGWSGRAGVDSVGYRLVRGFRQSVADRAFEPFAAICRKADARFDYRQLQEYEGPLWAMVTRRPAHLIDPRAKSWDALLLTSADAVLAEMRAIGPRLADRTWGERNTARIQHPLGRAIPTLGRWLDMPAAPLPGDGNMPRVQAPSFGASERFVVSPGHEEDGLFQMPGGQSGHPLSEHYADGEDDWAAGRPARFLPGPAVHTLTLQPAR